MTAAVRCSEVTNNARGLQSHSESRDGTGTLSERPSMCSELPRIQRRRNRDSTGHAPTVSSSEMPPAESCYLCGGGGSGLWILLLRTSAMRPLCASVTRVLVMPFNSPRLSPTPTSRMPQFFSAVRESKGDCKRE